MTRLTAAHHAHGKDGVVGHLGVSVVGEFAEGVQDVQTRVGHGNESQGEGHCSPQGGLTIPQLMMGKKLKKKKSLSSCECITQTQRPGEENNLALVFIIPIVMAET